jgi:hypothetical protein
MTLMANVMMMMSPQVGRWGGGEHTGGRRVHADEKRQAGARPAQAFLNHVGRIVGERSPSPRSLLQHCAAMPVSLAVLHSVERSLLRYFGIRVWVSDV